MHLSDGEKLIIAMLVELFDHLKVRGDLDAKFIGRALRGGNAWAIGRRYVGILGGEDADPSHVDEVFKILGAWVAIERAYGGLSPAERDRVRAGAGLTGDPKFPGFDENTEAAHLAIAAFVIENMSVYARLRGRDLNSRAPSTLEAHRRMLAAFARHAAGLGELTADDLVEVVGARRA